MHRLKDLRAYQRAAIAFIRDVKRCALFIGMGLGKTITVLTLIQQLIEELHCDRVLVIGPPRVARSVWSDEIDEWEHTQDLFCRAGTGTAKKRTEVFKSGCDIHTISFDLVEWMLQNKHEFDFSRYDMLVIDEGSKVNRDMGTRRYKAVAAICDEMKRLDKYIVILTGTPASEGLHQLYPLIHLLDHGRRLGATITDFRNRWFKSNYGSTGYTIKGAWAATAIQDRIADIVFTLREEDYLELPPRIDNEIKIELDDDMMRMYKKFKREYILETPGGVEIRSLTAATLGNKLLQLANGVVYDADKNETFFHKEKIEALREIVDGAMGEPIIVAYSFRADIRAIQKAFPQAVLIGNNPQTIKDWNAGKIPILLVHPDSAGHGLNLQFGGGILVWYGLTWSLEGYQQLNKRLHRSGQTRERVVIHHLIAKGTMDEVVMKSLKSKDRSQSSLLNALKRIIADELEPA